MSIYDDLQATLSSHQGEMALFARELREVCVFFAKAIIFTFIDKFNFSALCAKLLYLNAFKICD